MPRRHQVICREDDNCPGLFQVFCVLGDLNTLAPWGEGQAAMMAEEHMAKVGELGTGRKVYV